MFLLFKMLASGKKKDIGIQLKITNRLNLLKLRMLCIPYSFAVFFRRFTVAKTKTHYIRQI